MDGLRNWHKGSILVPILLLGILLVSGKVEAGASEKPTVALLPFFVEKGEETGRGSIYPFCKKVAKRGDVPPGSESILTRFLYEKMDAKQTFKVISSEKMAEALTRIERGELETSPVASSLRLGKELNADFVFAGFLFRFEERIGSPWGVKRPASVGFDLHLFRCRYGKMVWESRFHETQKPLSENLLKIFSFFRRGGYWLTAEELAGAGMEERLKKLPPAKELEETP